MPMKEWFRQMQPVQLYIILALTIAFFIVELIVSHLTHALTLLMNSYHMLCNIVALAGCIITIKYGKRPESDCDNKTKNIEISNEANQTKTIDHESALNPQSLVKKKWKAQSRANQEKKLKNTFGWARIDVVSMLICFVFMASLCFSLIVESLQTLVHISHNDEMHHPISVLCIGCAGLLINGICYLLIGGYTFHQGSFLYVTEAGDVVLNKVVVGESVRRGERRLSRTRNIAPSPPRQRQGWWEMFRDVLGCILVIICALLIYFVEDKQIAKYIDPILALVSAISIIILSYPYMKESCLILLQTIPATMNIDDLRVDLLKHFPDILNIHDFHIWQLTANKVISTVHIIFQNPKVYHEIMENVKEFLTDNGITQVTIQPEFFTNHNPDCLKSLPPICLMSCKGEGCKDNHCCQHYTSTEILHLSSPSEECIPTKYVKESFDDETPQEHSAPSSLNGSDKCLTVNKSKSEIDLTKTRIIARLDKSKSDTNLTAISLTNSNKQC